MFGKILCIWLLYIIFVNCDIPGDNPICSDFGIGTALVNYDGYTLLSINDYNNPKIYTQLMTQYNLIESFLGLWGQKNQYGLPGLGNSTQMASECLLLDSNLKCVTANGNNLVISDHAGHCMRSYISSKYYLFYSNNSPMTTLREYTFGTFNCDDIIDIGSTFAGVYGKCSTIFEMKCGDTKTINIQSGETITMKFTIDNDNYRGHFDACNTGTDFDVQMRIYDNTTKQLMNCDYVKSVSSKTECNICDKLYNSPIISYNYQNYKGKAFTLEIKASKLSPNNNGKIELNWDCDTDSISTIKPVTTSDENNSNMDSFFDTYLNNPLILVLLGVILFSLCLLLIICVYKYRKIKRVHQNNREGEVALIDVSINEIDRDNIMNISDEKEGIKIVDPEIEVEYQDEQKIPQNVLDSQLKMLENCQNKKGKSLSKKCKKSKDKRGRKKSKSKLKSKSKSKKKIDIDKQNESDSGVMDTTDIAAADPNNVIYYEGYVDEYELNRDGI